jgi:hypothetical protein
MTVHETLHGKTDITIKLTTSSSIDTPPVWKTVENFRALFLAVSAREWSRRVPAALLLHAVRDVRLSACSGCTGDYEDPDATSWTEDFTNGLTGDEKSEQPAMPERFPVQRN